MGGMDMQYVWRYDSPLGQITMASDGDGLTGLWFEGQKYFAPTLAAGGYRQCVVPVFKLVCEWLDCYFGGTEPCFTLPLHLAGTPFRMAVWEVLREIPYGRVTTYKRVAEHVAARYGAKVSVRAVGGAVGHNPVSIIVPCHRVIGSDGWLTGYAGGIDRKVSLLECEGVDMNGLKW